jgi:hypothetical protein
MAGIEDILKLQLILPAEALLRLMGRKKVEELLEMAMAAGYDRSQGRPIDIQLHYEPSCFATDWRELVPGLMVAPHLVDFGVPNTLFLPFTVV